MLDARWSNRTEVPFASLYLQVPAGRLHYVDEGRKAQVVMVHSNILNLAKLSCTSAANCRP